MSTGTISSLPCRLVLTSNALGTATLSWSTEGIDNAEVWVSVDGEQPEQLFAQAPWGTQAASWIQVGHYYLFKLYEGTAHQHLLAWTSVTTQLPPATQIGFNYWPANNGWPGGGWGSAALDDANWSALLPTVAADLDHMVSLGAGALRLMFWPNANGFELPASIGAPAVFSSGYAQQTNNLVELLSMCQARNLQIVIAFGNNYLDSGPAVPMGGMTRWWMLSYGNTQAGFTRFLNDCKTWIDGYVQAAESSPYRDTIIYYDYQNENFDGHPFMDWYLTFMHDWSTIPRGKHGCSVLHVPSDIDGLLRQLAESGPEQGRRRLDYVDFHSYPSHGAGVNAEIESSYDYVRSKFPDSVIIVGESGYLSADETKQANGVIDLMQRCKAKGIPYCLNWMLWDDHSIGGGGGNSTTWGYDKHTPKAVLGRMAADVGLLVNPNFDLVTNNSPDAWQADGTVPVELKSVGPDDALTAATHRYASLSTSQAGGLWISSFMTAVDAGRHFYVNAYLRSNMKNVRMNIIEYDTNNAEITRHIGPSFTPVDFRFVSYLHSVGSWSVMLTTSAKFVIVNISAETTGPSFLDVAAVSAAQR
jgi:hypothetical protein